MANFTLDELVDKYVRIRNVKRSAADAYKKEVSRIDSALEKLEGLIQVALDAAGAESVRTNHGTAYKKTASRVSVKDRDVFYSWAVDTNNLGAIDMKANAKNVRELLHENIEVPGVNYSEIITIGVRSA
ncbi:MAG: hypothetical protein ACK5LJ_14225 [Paracoccus sp. (in: a-proteobacteria)]